MKPRFTLRDLFWLTLVVAMGLAWYVDSREVAWTANSSALSRVE